MIDVDPVEDLDRDAAAAAVSDGHRFLVAEETRLFRLAAHWADLHCPDATQGSDAVLPGTERARRCGGVGTPSVLEFAPAEFATLQEMTTSSAVAMISDALDVRHRLPRLWRLVLSGGVRVWKARRIAVATRHLSAEAAAKVDAAIDGYVNAMGWGRFLKLLRAKIISADPAEAERARRHAEADRFVRAGQIDEHGLQTLVIRARAGVIRWFTATVERIAAILALEGDGRPLDIRRSEAIGILGQPAIALEMLVRHAHHDEFAHQHTSHADTGESEAGQGEAGQGDAGQGDESSADANPGEADQGDSGSSDHTAKPDAAVDDPQGGAETSTTDDTLIGDDDPIGDGDLIGEGDIHPAVNDADDHPPALDPPDAGPPDAGSPGAGPPGGGSPPGTTGPPGTGPPGSTGPPGGGSARPGLVLPEKFSLEGVDLKKLRPDVVLYLHLDAATFVQLTLEAGRFEGVGPITSSQIRAFCGGDAHVTIKPVLDLDNIQPVDGYAYPAKMRDALHQRTPYDVFPYGTSDSRRMQIDHTTPYRPISKGGPPGQTSLANGGPLTTYHHRVKTFADWQHCQPRPGTYFWRSPTGHVHLVDHNGTHDLGHDQLAQALWQAAHTHTINDTEEWIRWALTTARQTETDAPAAPPPMPQQTGSRPRGPIPAWSNSREPLHRTDLVHRHRRITTHRGTRDMITTIPGTITLTGEHQQ